MLELLMSMSVILFSIVMVSWLASLLSGAIWGIISVLVGGYILWRVLKYAREQKGN